MHLSPEAIRRMNDENYYIALEEFRRNRFEEYEHKISEEIKEKPWRKKHYDRMTKRLNSMSLDDFMDFLNKSIASEVGDIVEFNKKWDKQNYKVIPFK